MLKKEAETVLAFDYGLKRIGVATGNLVTKTGNPLTIIYWRTNDQKWVGIEKIIREWQPDLLLVGLPSHSDGTPNSMTNTCRKFGSQLKGRFKLPVEFVDERFSSVEAESREGAGEYIDDEAALVLLEQWMNKEG